MDGRRKFLLAISALGLCVACRSAPPMRVEQPVAETAGSARVLLTEVDGDIFELSVLNLSPRPMVVLRNQIVLRTPLGTRSRESGGLSSTYNIPSGGAHDVHVRYDMSDLAAGDVIQLRFEDALLIDGQPVPIGPIVLRVTGRERSR